MIKLLIEVKDISFGTKYIRGLAVRTFFFCLSKTIIFLEITNLKVTQSNIEYQSEYLYYCVPTGINTGVLILSMW